MDGRRPGHDGVADRRRRGRPDHRLSRPAASVLAHPRHAPPCQPDPRSPSSALVLIPAHSSLVVIGVYPLASPSWLPHPPEWPGDPLTEAELTGRSRRPCATRPRGRERALRLSGVHGRRRGVDRAALATRVGRAGVSAAGAGHHRRDRRHWVLDGAVGALTVALGFTAARWLHRNRPPPVVAAREPLARDRARRRLRARDRLLRRALGRPRVTHRSLGRLYRRAVADRRCGGAGAPSATRLRPPPRNESPGPGRESLAERMPAAPS